MRRILIILLSAYAALQVYALTAIAFQFWIGLAFTSLSTVIAFIFAILHSGWRMGWRKAVLLLVLSFSVSLAFESIGVATGIIYGAYHYTDRLGPKFLNLVPYLIPLAWFMMMYPSYVMAEILLGAFSRLKGGQIPLPPSLQESFASMLKLAALGGLIMTAWDVAMDPMMVKAGNWVWETDGAYFGVPLQNYWGWWLTTFTVYLLFGWLSRKWQAIRRSKPAWSGAGQADDRLVVISYLLTTASTLVVNVLIGLGGPALAGFFAALPWGISAFWLAKPHK